MVTPYDRTLIMMLIILALFASIFLVENKKFNDNIIEIQKAAELKVLRKENFKKEINSLDLKAKAFSIYNASSKKSVYGVNDDMVLPLASLAKTMTAMVVLDEYSPESVFEVTKKSISQEGDYGLIEGEKWKLSELIKFTLIYSSNDGAVTISAQDKSFLNKMNEKAKSIGLTKTYFNNITGLDENKDKEISGAYGTAQDANKMAIYALENYGSIFSTTTKESLALTSDSGLVHNIKNTNIILNKIPNVLFSKTGYTELAGGNLTTLFKDKKGNILAITVLQSTQNDRFSDVEKIVNLLYNYPYEI